MTETSHGSGVTGMGRSDRVLPVAEIARVVETSLASLDADGRRVLVLIPDGTRTMPMPLFFDLLDRGLGTRASALDYLVALGTHQPMSDEQLGRLVGRPVREGLVGRSRIFNHRWDRPETFARLGVLSPSETAELSEGRLAVEVPVSLNRLVLDYDHLIVCGPVFPHEVVGFSGGSKYFFPGIAGPDIINFTHWLGALITNYSVIGAGYTPVRAVIDRAARFVDRPISCFSLVVTHEGVAGIYYGGLHESWQAAAALSAVCHIRHVDAPFRRVLSIMPELYDDLWTAAKGMYKLEPAIADGGEVVIFAPHITEVSYTHGRLLDEVGYHCRDYFTGQWDRFKSYPGGVLAHSTHLRGMGTFDAATGTETSRISVVLATGIPKERCRRLSLGYMDPASIDVDTWRGRESEGVVVIPRAGEELAPPPRMTAAHSGESQMTAKALSIPATGALDFVSLGALVHRLDPGVVPFRKATACQIHVSGGELNCAANLADCFGLTTGVVSAMVDYPIGDLIADRVRAMGVRGFYKRFAHDGVRGPNMAAVYSDRGFGARPPVVFYNRANEAAALLKPGDFDWSRIFSGGVRWFHSGGIFASLSPATAELIVEAMRAAKAAGAVTSFDLNYREKLWKTSGGSARAVSVLRGIVDHVDVLVGNEEDLQKGLGITGPEAATSSLDPGAFIAMIDRVVAAHPSIKAVATTLREVRSSTEHRWSAVAWVEGETCVAPTADLHVYDRVGGGDGFASGFFYGLLAGESPAEAVKLGWAHGALLTTFPGDTTMASLEQVRAFARGASARIQR